MAHNYYYNILPIADCEDSPQWDAHCNAVQCLLRYAVKSLSEEFEQDKHVDFDSKEAALVQVLGWAKQLELIEVKF